VKTIARMTGIGPQVRKHLPISLALACLFLLFLVQVASAHARLVKAIPAPGSVLAVAPTQVHLFYDEDVDPNFSEVQVLDKNLQRVDNNDVKPVPGDSKQLLITLKPLSDGTYTVAWKALSNTDGHITRGNFAFSVGNVTGPVVAPVAQVSGNVSETDPLSVIVRWLNYLTILALVGSYFFAVLLLERSLRAVSVPESAEASVWGMWRQLALAAFVVAVLTTIASLFLEASLVGNVQLADLASSDALSRTLLQTRFGTLWVARMVLLIADGSFLFIRIRFSRWAGAVIGLPLLLTISLGGHSAAAGGTVSVPLVADWLHLTGVSIWVGGLFNFFATMMKLWRIVKAEKRARWIAWMVPQFSAIAIPATVVIAVTGFYNSLLQIPTLDSLFSTTYGNVLTVKVALFLVMIAFGAINLLILSARFRRAAEHPERSHQLFTRFRITVGAEVALGVSAMFLAGLLTLEPPARTSIEEPSAPNLAQNSTTPAQQSAVLVDYAAPDVEVTLTLSPTLQVPTTFDVYLTDPKSTTGTPTPSTAVTTGTPIKNALRVIVQFTLLDQDQGITTQIAQAHGDGHYVVSGAQLTLPGMWKMHVIVRRAGVDDVTVDFPVFHTGPQTPTAAGDPKAMQVLKDSEAMMNQLESLHSKQDLNDGSNGVVITNYDYHSPDAMRFDVLGEASSIAIGPKQYYQDKNGNWTERARVDPFVFPQFDASTQATNVQLGRPDILNGEQTQIVRYAIPDASGGEGTQYAQWISSKDDRLIQLAMVAPSHYMMQYYMDYNSPQIAVAAPSKIVPPTPAPAQAPAVVAAPVMTRPAGPITGDLEADVALGILVAGVAVGLLASGRKRLRRQRYVLLGVSVVAILASVGLAVDAFNGMAAVVANTPIDTSQAALGKPLYDANCSPCHGVTGHGDGPAGKALPVKPFDLTTHVLLHDEQYLDAVISNGRGYMPAWKDHLTQDQIFDIIAYTRLLARNARQGGLPGFTPGAGGGFTPQPGFTPQVGFTSQPGFTPAPATPGTPSPSAIASTTPTPATSGLVQERTIGDLIASIDIKPTIFQPADVEIRLSDLNGQPAQDIQRVDIAMAMDGMDHGAIGITATPAGQGVYDAHAMLLVMEGPWFMALRITRTDGSQQSGVFAFNVPPDVETGVVDPMYTRPTDPTQVVDLAVYPDSMLPREVTVTAHHPVRLEIMFVNRPACGRTVSFPQLKLNTSVTSEGLAELSFVPAQTGKLLFACKLSGLEISEGG
jgi:copper transport protein